MGYSPWRRYVVIRKPPLTPKQQKARAKGKRAKQARKKNRENRNNQLKAERIKLAIELNGTK